MVNGFDQKDAPVLYHGTVLDTGYWPARGIVYSLLVHTMLFSALLYISISGVLAPSPLRAERRPDGERLDLREVIYLPVLGPGDAGQAPGELGEGEEVPSVASARPPEGLSYPGPQPIVSEVPDPTNSFQTVLRPALEDPELIEPSLALPNLIQLEDRPAVVQAEAPSREALIDPFLEAAVEPEETPEPAPLERLDLDAETRADLSALARELDAAQPLPAEPVPVAVPERALDAVDATDLGALAANRNPLQALPARDVDLALPMRALDPVETTEIPELVVARNPAQPLPVREAATVLPTRSLDAPAADREALAELGAGTRSVQPLPVDPLDTALPRREVEAIELADLAASRTSASRGAAALPGGSVTTVLPERGFDLPQLDVNAGSGGTALEDILALSPMPASERGPLPTGEARGVFAISPRPSLETSNTRPGVRADEAGEREATDGELSSLADLTGPASDNGSSGNGAEAGGGTAADSGGGGDVDDAGRGAEGTGTGEGGGRNPFPGVRILAGGTEPPASPAANGLQVVGGYVSGETRAPDNPEPTGGPGHLQRSYTVTVVTTESSGGGLPSFGVFADEQVHTVFVDMRESPGDETPAWTVEYGVPSGIRVQATTGPDADVELPGFVLPFPIDRVQPAFPPQIAARFPQEMVIAYAVINAEGKLEHIAVKRSPDPRFVQPVYDSLAQWTFRAARLDGAAVAVKMLLGIPLARR